MVLFNWCEFFLDAQDLQNFNKCYKQLRALEERPVSPDDQARTNLILGRYYAKTKYFVKAASHFDKAEILFKHSFMRLELVQVYYYRSDMELMRYKKEVAKRYIKKALVLTKQIGVKSWERKIKKLLQTS